MRPRFLLDENLSHDIVVGVKHYNAAIDILFVGAPGAPPLGTKDPEILDSCERERRILITKNRRSMPGHLAAHLQTGRHYWGLLSIKEGREGDIGGIVQSLTLIWEVQEAEEYLDTRAWIPF